MSVAIHENESTRDLTVVDYKQVGPWNPTPKEFATYKKRELELAIREITRSKGVLIRSGSLFSEQTIAAAHAAYKAKQ